MQKKSVSKRWHTSQVQLGLLRSNFLPAATFFEVRLIAYTFTGDVYFSNATGTGGLVGPPKAWCASSVGHPIFCPLLPLTMLHLVPNSMSHRFSYDVRSKNSETEITPIVISCHSVLLIVHLLSAFRRCAKLFFIRFYDVLCLSHSFASFSIADTSDSILWCEVFSYPLLAGLFWASPLFLTRVHLWNSYVIVGHK